MNKERLRRKLDTTPHPYLTDHQFKRPFKGEEQSSFCRGKIDFLKKEDWKDIVPSDVETSINAFQSTTEEVTSSWEDILSDNFPSSSEDNDSSTEMIDLGTELAEHSSPEIMRFEGSNFSEEIISLIEYPRKTVDFVDLDSDSNFSPKLASSQIDFSFKNSRIFDRPIHESTKLRIPLEEATGDAPDISYFTKDNEADSLENENSLPSTITAPDIYNFEEGGKDELVIETTSTGFENVLNFFGKGSENKETSFITTINTEDIVDTVFKYPGEPNSPNFDDAFNTTGGPDEQLSLVRKETKSLNRTLVNTPQTGRREKISPRQIFIHSKLSSGELNSSIIRQSSRKNAGKQKKGRIRLYAPNPPKPTNCSGTRNQDPYAFPSDESDFNGEITLPNPYVLLNDDLHFDEETSIPNNWGSSVAGKLRARKKTPGVKSKRGRKKKASSKYPASWVSLSKEEVQEHAEYMKTIPICPLSLHKTLAAQERKNIKFFRSDEM